MSKHHLFAQLKPALKPIAPALFEQELLASQNANSYEKYLIQYIVNPNWFYPVH